MPRRGGLVATRGMRLKPLAGQTLGFVDSLPESLFLALPGSVLVDHPLTVTQRHHVNGFPAVDRLIESRLSGEAREYGPRCPEPNRGIRVV